MTIDGKLLARARAALAAKKAENAAEHERRQKTAYTRAPSISAVERSLRALISDVVGVALKTREDPEKTLARIEKESLELLAQRAELLVANGFPADYLDENYVCKTCSDNGYDDKGRMCPCLLALYEAERAKELSVLEKLGADSFLDFRLDFYDNTQPDATIGLTARQCMETVLASCRDFAENFDKASPSLLFRGGTGLGKTLLSACVARVVSKKGHSVVYETATAAFEAFEARKFSRDAAVLDAAEQAVQKILHCELLILDDLGTEMTTNFTQSALYTIINTRLSENRKTIISTNLSKSELDGRYTPQIASRLSGEYDTLIFLGRDIRAIKKEQRYS